ncbi:MAG TPA: NUDIX hydrolase [Anaerolineae bacterium]
MDSEKVRSSRRVYQGQLIDLRVDQVETPNGLEAIREVIEHPGAVAVVPMDARGQVILVRQYRHAAGRTMIEVPAGTLKPGEDPLEAVRRELREETGFEARHIVRIGGLYTAPSFNTEYIHLYLATDLTPGLAATDDDEVIELLRIPLAEAISLIRAGSIDDSKSVSALLLVNLIVTEQATARKT